MFNAIENVEINLRGAQRFAMTELPVLPCVLELNAP